MERNSFLINKKIHQYILPGVLMTVAMQLGNVVDGMIVGNLLGAEAMAAIEISMPVLLLLQMAAMMLAMGGAAEAAVLLGKRDMRKPAGCLPLRWQPVLLYPSFLHCLRQFCRDRLPCCLRVMGIWPRLPSRI